MNVFKLFLFIALLLTFSFGAKTLPKHLPPEEAFNVSATITKYQTKINHQKEYNTKYEIYKKTRE